MSSAKRTTAKTKAAVVPKYGVFEIPLTLAEDLENPFWDAKVTAVFTSPTGKEHTVEGFCYAGRAWRVRFVPRQHGRWRFEVTATAALQNGATSGAFECKGTAGHGFLRISQRNRYRLEYEDGTPFYPVGVQTGGFTRVGFDGPQARGHRWRTVPIAEWVKAFEGATNLVRWQMIPGGRPQDSLALIAGGRPLDQYDTTIAAKMDNLYRLQKAHGFSHILIPFEDISLWGNRGTPFGNVRDQKEYKSLKAKNLPLQEKYLRYLVARFACFVDIWELFNEDSFAPNDYLAHLAKLVRQADPYDHIITTNYARPAEDWCEIITWHEYMGMPANQVDAYLAQEISKFKAYGKVVLNTESGNQGWLSNYDPIKWRIAVWTAFMNESSMLFWNSSGAKSTGRRPYRGNANAYLGPESRQFFRVLNKFTREMPIDMRPVASGYTEHNDVRTYALSNGEVTAVYVHHFSDHEKAYELPDPLFVQTGPGKFRLRWINPADGKVVKTGTAATTQQYLAIKLPPVTIDLACRIDRVEPGK
jgi:hypothetical protein